MTPDDMRQEVELKVVEFIKDKLANGTMTEERSQKIAQHVLDSLKPGMNYEQLYKAIFKLDDYFNELSIITLPYIRDYEKNVTKKVEEGVRSLIQQGQYDAAEKLAHKAISGDVKLVYQATAKPDASGNTASVPSA